MTENQSKQLSDIPVKTLKCGFSMPVFGAGTWLFGGGVARNPANDDQGNIESLKRAIQAGISHIDTAEYYADGHAETLVGEAIKGCRRDDLFLVSKVWPTNLKYADVLKSVRQSLSRLGTEYLDLLLIHKPNPEIPIEETMRAFDTLVDSGDVKHIGLSNFSVQRMKEAQAASKNKIVANQVHYNLMFREPEKENVLEYCQKNEMFCIAWRPVQKGVLGVNESSLLWEMCQKYSKSPVQVAINWLISQDAVLSLSTMRSELHLSENLGALGWQMDVEDIERLRLEFPDQKNVSDSVPLI